MLFNFVYSHKKTNRMNNLKFISLERNTVRTHMRATLGFYYELLLYNRVDRMLD